MRRVGEAPQQRHAVARGEIRSACRELFFYNATTQPALRVDGFQGLVSGRESLAA